VKLLLVNAINSKKRIETVYPALGLGYLAAYLKKHKPAVQVKIIDRNIAGTIKEFCPDIVGVSSVSQNFSRAIEIGALCKTLKIPVFIGGVHITLFPESLSEAFDFGVYGEGEETIIDIVDFFSKVRSLFSAELEKIKGLVLHNGKGIKLTEPRPIIYDLDTIPFPDRSLLNIPVGQTTYLFTSRGCPYKCAFCASSRFWSGVRWFPAEYVVNEIEEVVKRYRPWAISFYDDLFIANFRRLEKIVELICKKGINKKVKFSFSCRANLVDERLIRVLKPLKVQMICMGLESGCQKTLNYLKGDGISVAQNQRAVDLLSKAKINVQGTFIIGSPDESENEIFQTLDFIRRSRLANFAVYVLTPFPGTPVWESAQRMGLVSKDMDWSRLSVEIGDCKEDKILLSGIPRSRLLEIYALFEKERTKRRLHYMLKTGITHPAWFFKKISNIISSKLRKESPEK